MGDESEQDALLNIGGLGVYYTITMIRNPLYYHYCNKEPPKKSIANYYCLYIGQRAKSARAPPPSVESKEKPQAL